MIDSRQLYGGKIDEKCDLLSIYTNGNSLMDLPALDADPPNPPPKPPALRSIKQEREVGRKEKNGISASVTVNIFFLCFLLFAYRS
jgi:hypothetical protein